MKKFFNWYFYFLGNTNAIDTIVTVILQDINDQPPKLPEINATSVTENTNNVKQLT